MYSYKACSEKLYTCMYIQRKHIFFTAYLRFSQSVYTFTEEDGAGSIMVKGTPGLTANVMGGGWKLSV